MCRILLLLISFYFIPASLFAQGKEDSIKQMMDEFKRIDSIEKTLHYKTGKIELNGGMASIDIPAGFKFLDPVEAKYVIENIWGNPPSAEPPSGLLFPAGSGATDPGSYAFVVKFENMGYVKDDDAGKINYDDLLKDMKESTVKDNEERRKSGLVTMDLIGWAAKPYYDKDKKVLYWAKEFSVSGRPENTLNYDVRVLGRKGVLTLQAVSGMDQSDSVNRHIHDILGMVSFNEGNRYADFDAKTDNVAVWTIGGLVAGKIADKAGFFAVILKFLKYILVGIVLVAGATWRFISRKKKKKKVFAYEPSGNSNQGN
ncbi:MAG: DUF2167 domain-containing protein [Bacteroidota bacterium]|nr:DUF2167 domain-containing protein [Bacteroidota bacterium]